MRAIPQLVSAPLNPIPIDKQHFLHDLHNVPFQVAEIFDDVDDRLDTCLIVYMRTFFVSTHL